MNWSRRDFAVMLPTLLTSLSLSTDEQSRLPSEVYIFQDLPVRHSDKLDFRPIVAGKTVDGCKVAVHESVLAPKSEPHQPHHHDGEEIFLMLEGTLDVTINGESSRISRGSIASSDWETSTESATRERLRQGTTSLSWVRDAKSREILWTDWEEISVLLCPECLHLHPR